MDLKQLLKVASAIYLTFVLWRMFHSSWSIKRRGCTNTSMELLLLSSDAWRFSVLSVSLILCGNRTWCLRKCRGATSSRAQTESERNWLSCLTMVSPDKIDILWEVAFLCSGIHIPFDCAQRFRILMPFSKWAWIKHHNLQIGSVCVA